MLPSPGRVLGPGSSVLLPVVLVAVVVVQVVVVETEVRRKVVVGKEGNGEKGGGGEDGEVASAGVIGAWTTTGEEGDVLVVARGMVVVQVTKEERVGVYTVRGRGGLGRRMGTCDIVRAGAGAGVTWGLVEAGGRTLDRDN